MTKEKDGGSVRVPCKDNSFEKPVRSTGDFSERKAPEPVRDTIPPPPPREKK